MRAIDDWRNRFPLHYAKEEGVLYPQLVVERIDALTRDREVVLTTEVGQNQMWAAQYFDYAEPRLWLTSGSMGTIGFGLPAAIGAQVACPDKIVVDIAGDSSIQMNIQELATAVEQQANIKIILMNNNALGLVHQQQTLFYGQRTFASDYELKMDFIAIASGFGMPTFDLGSCDDHADMLHQALQSSGPCLIHVPIDVKDKVFPMVPPGAANTEMIGG